MRLRLLSLAFLLGVLGTGVSWLTLQPMMVRLVEGLARSAQPDSPEAAFLFYVQRTLPLALVADLLLLSALCFLVLYVFVARPLRRTEVAVDALSQLNLTMPFAQAGGPLLSRIQAALNRMAGALSEEQALTKSQLRELREANERLAAAQTELVASDRLATVGKLAAGVAHEVGNPLSGILGYLSVIRSRTADSPEVSDCLTRIEVEVQRINQIVRGLLDLGRPMRMALGPVEVRSVVENCLRLLRAGPEFESVTVRVEVDPTVVVRAESGPLSQVVINLLLNGAQALSGPGELFVHARRSATGAYEIFFDDSGSGISTDALPQLFDPFFSTKDSGKGTGLGLAVSRHLAAAMNGTLRAENLPARGARFVLTLPPA